MTGTTPAWETWVSVTATRMADIVTDPLAQRIYSLALAVAAEKDTLIEQAVRMGETAAAALQAELTEARSEIARLKAETDEQRGRRVYHCLERDFGLIQGQLRLGDVSEGDIIRATDTGRELVWMEDAWQDQR